MTPRSEQCAAAVRRYLERAGCETLNGLWNGLRRAYTQAEIRKALKDLDAQPRKIGDWPKYMPDGSRWPAVDKARSWSTDGTPNFVDPFTLYKLGAWEARMAPAPEVTP